MSFPPLAGAFGWGLGFGLTFGIRIYRKYQIPQIGEIAFSIPLWVAERIPHRFVWSKHSDYLSLKEK